MALLYLRHRKCRQFAYRSALTTGKLSIFALVFSLPAAKDYFMSMIHLLQVFFIHFPAVIFILCPKPWEIHNIYICLYIFFQHCHTKGRKAWKVHLNHLMLHGKELKINKRRETWFSLCGGRLSHVSHKESVSGFILTVVWIIWGFLLRFEHNLNI